MVRLSDHVTGINATAGYEISFDQEVYDDGGWHASNSASLVVPAGVTRVRVGAAMVLTGVAASTGVGMYIGKNEEYAFDGANGVFSSGPPVGSPLLSFSSGPVPVQEGDHFELYLVLTGDTSVNIIADRTNFWIEAV
jgi:hypothetical protein